MQSVRTDSIKTKRYAVLSAAALLAGLASFSLSACDSTESPPACTTTNDPAALITLTAPSCATSFKVGSTMTVRWTVKDDPEAPTAVDIKMSVDGGTTWGFVNAASIPDNSNLWGEFPWVVKDSLKINNVNVGLAGKKALVRVMQYSTGEAKKISTLVDPITITAP